MEKVAENETHKTTQQEKQRIREEWKVEEWKVVGGSWE